MGQVKYREIQKGNNLVIEEIHKVIVHRFSVGDVEDPDLYAAQPIYEWQNSEQGQFVMKHCLNKPEWQRYIDYETFSYQYVIIAELEKAKLSEYYLRFGKQ